MLIKHLSFFLGQSRDLKMFKSYSPLLGLQTSVVSYLHFTLSFNSKGIFTNLQSQSLFEFTHMFTDFPCSPLIICISDISDLFVLPQVWILEIPLRKVCCGELYVLVYLKITLYFFPWEIFLLEIQFWLQAIFSHTFDQAILLYSGFHSCKKVFCQSNYQSFIGYLFF